LPRRPQQIPARPPLSEEKIESACYAGSAEHKAKRWWGGLPQGYVNQSGVAARPKKQQTTICPFTTETERVTATGWVRDALRAGQIKYCESDKDFPARIWYREDATNIVWIGYCLNSIMGQYKGWPANESERLAIFD
jgi:hypothetical protein